MTIIDLQSERSRRDGPDAKFVSYDEDGRDMFAFAMSYRMDDATYCICVFAYDFDDAEKRAAAISTGLQVDGQIYSEIT